MYIFHALTLINTVFFPHGVIMFLISFPELTAIILLNSIDRLLYVMGKASVFFAVEIDFLNAI
jgi:hypothetical protein